MLVARLVSHTGPLFQLDILLVWIALNVSRVAFHVLAFWFAFDVLVIRITTFIFPNSLSVVGSVFTLITEELIIDEVWSLLFHLLLDNILWQLNEILVIKLQILIKLSVHAIHGLVVVHLRVLHVRNWLSNWS